ncbi:hypothetical protein SISNIDRAFT_445714 [Sistotremastrum niveocremeum HHB9708]|uniref:Uncharacterized protein n=1 Tax=Sistotremastrum niveocremeum HHB9708 TaxID=1314777 RepID=A0A164PBP1_9AGAM|nr:hypothetical protein SISNIDRAFT_445714 [Sistotremastrum niveocremeum HHB9708]
MEHFKPLDLRTESPNPSPHTPTSYESKFYYAGISPTPPPLIYRSSSLSRPFNPPTGPEAYRKLKELRPVSDHPIVQIWGEWTSVDGVRFLGDEDVVEEKQGAGGRKLSPVVIWIGLTPSSTSASTAHEISQSILAILASYEIPDVEVEFRESTYTPYTGPALLECVEEFDPTAGAREALTPSLGLSIAPATANGSDVRGALGVYFTTGEGKGEKLYGLTSRHVVFPSSSSSDANEDYTHTAGDPKENIQLLGTKGYENLLDSIRSRVRLHGSTVDILSSKLKSYEEKLLVAASPDEGDKDQLAKKLARTRAELEETNRAIEALEKFYGDVERDWSKPEDRIIGHVVRAPAVQVDAEGYIKDLAFVELDQDKFRECRGSFIDLGTEIEPTKLTYILSPDLHGDVNLDPTGNRSFQYPIDRLLPMRGIRPSLPSSLPSTNTSLSNSSDAKESPYKIPPQALAVLKNGPATGLTIGLLSPLSSFIRNPKTGLISTQWAIVNYNNPWAKNDGPGVFAARGDSGCVVVDKGGKMVGMIQGGSGKNGDEEGGGGGGDVVYVTPMVKIWEWVLEAYPDARIYEGASENLPVGA